MTIPEIVRRHSQPLQPLPTDIKVHADPIPGIRAVLFDVYGTLLISASGDIDQSAGSNPGAAALEALAAVNVTPSGTGGAAGDTGKTVVDRLRHAIRQRHEASPWANPEIDIRDVWTDVLDELTADGYLVAEAGRDADVARLAVEYEVRVNPVWTMPQLVRCLTAIRQGGLALGIISNAQFFTLELFPALLGQDVLQLGFDAGLCFWSFEHGQAKPGTFLFEQAAIALADRGITPDEVLYLGNDIRNDIGPAARVGFHTVLFAGDARSLRLREDDPSLRDVVPAGVISELSQLLAVLQLAGEREPRINDRRSAHG